jgi:hypothetical protein
MAGTIVERWRRIDPLLALFTALSAATLVIDGGIQGELFDRYVIPVVPGVLVILLASPVPVDGLIRRAAQRLGRLPTLHVGPKLALRWWYLAVGGAAAVLVAVLSIALAMNTWSYDRARWDDATALLKQGIPATRIDAGMEWLGWHSPDGTPHHSQSFGALIGWAPGQFAARKPCVEFYTSALPASTLRSAHWRLASVYTYPTYLLAGTARLYDYDTGALGCPVKN